MEAIHVIDIKAAKINEQLSVLSQQVYPADTFPSKYIHCAIDDLRDAVQAVEALQAAGYAASSISLVTSWDFAEALERSYQQRCSLSQAFAHFIDSGFDEVYRQEASRGHHILTVHLSNFEQIEQVRNVLAPHYAHRMKYIDTWTTADLIR
jgi:hypothetical protein